MSQSDITHRLYLSCHQSSRRGILAFLTSLLLWCLASSPRVQGSMEEDAATDHVYYKEELFIDFLGMHQRQEIDLADEPAHVAKQILGPMTQSIEDRLSSLFHKAKTPECRAKIAEHFGYFVNSIGKEEGAPFEDIEFYNHCPEPVYDWDDLPDDIHIGMIQNRSYQPPHNESVYIDDPKNLKILYAILAHDDATATERLVDALYEDGHVFVIHVDGKESSDATYRQLVNYAATRNYVHVLDDSRRVRINWGGFSMVNATMQILKYSFAVDEPNRQPLDFHKFFHVASTSYPLASNAEIRQRLSDFPLDANLMHVILKPSRPPATSWFYFVECDDAVHRIHRLKPLQKETAGIELYTSSQWFIISREFAEYLATAGPGTLAHDFLEYAEHVVVADETYFGTVLRHTEFCTKHHNRNFLHLQFDRWESELPADKRDERKCMMKDPNHCGRSPTVLTVDYVDILELTDDLFARKFVDSVDTKVKSIVDEWRVRRDSDDYKSHSQLAFEGHGVLIVAKATVNDAVPLCLGLGTKGNVPKLVPCFYDGVVETFAENWETGAVILEETLPYNRWQIGPCTTDGEAKRLRTAEMEVTPGKYSITGPRCMFKQMDGIREGRCIDSDSGTTQPGGPMHIYPCVNRWFQFFAFGDGKIAPKGSIYTKIPSRVVQQISNLGHDWIPYMCYGVYGLGDADEETWNNEEEEEDEGEEDENYEDQWHRHDEGFAFDSSLPDTDKDDKVKDDPGKPQSILSAFNGHEVITTQCSNSGAVIEWLFVPFILEDPPEEKDGEEL